MLFFGAIVTGTWSLVCDWSVSYIWSRWVGTRWGQSDFCWFWILGRHGLVLVALMLCPYLVTFPQQFTQASLELCWIHAQTESLAHYFGYQLCWMQWFMAVHHTLNLISLDPIVVITSNWRSNYNKSPHYFIYLCKMSVQCKINALCQQVHKVDPFSKRIRT